MTLAALGWAVVHSLWQCTFVAGLVAMALGLIRDSRAHVRYLVACTGLALMALTAVVTAFAGNTYIGSRVRFQVLYAIDGALGDSIPAIVSWGSTIVPAVGVVWLAGLVVCLIRIGVVWRRARDLRYRDLRDAGETVHSRVADLRAEMSLHGAVDVRCSARASVPMLLGWRRPLILLPTGTASALTPGQLRAVLAHELAHVRRRDYLANLILMIAEVLLFHHPAARWVGRRIRTEREYCCDDVAVTIEKDKGAYARALAALEDARGDDPLVVAAASGTLLDRIQRIAGHPRPVLTPARGLVALVMASLLAATILAISMIVPPSLPAGAELRRRVPPPAGVSQPAGQPKLPRSPRR